MYQHYGKCICHSVNVQFFSSRDLSSFTARKCDCQYCIEQGIEYLSDPLGQIILATSFPLLEEKQGTEEATFLLCCNCQTVVAVSYTDNNFLLGSINATLLDDHKKMPSSIVVSPKSLDKFNRVQRWRELWSEMLVKLI